MAVAAGKLNLPGPERIAGTNVHFPFVFVGDDAFPLKENLMKHFPREMIHTPEIYNYREQEELLKIPAEYWKLIFSMSKMLYLAQCFIKNLTRCFFNNRNLVQENKEITKLH